MGKRESYTPGTFCWIELTTTDSDAAKSFYGDLFGWTCEDFPVGENGTYSMMLLDGDVVAGLYEMGEGMTSQGITPYWLSYVSVEDANAVTEAVGSLGGEVVEQPMDIPGSGRTAVIRDREGTILPVWEAQGHIGSSRVNDPGCFTWNELQTRDPEGASRFYEGLFGWNTKPEVQDGNTVYVTIYNADAVNGGMMPMSPDQTDAPPNWMTYFTTVDIDASIGKIESHGGGVHAGPMEIMPGSRIAVVHDPQGATFALFEGETDE